MVYHLLLSIKKKLFSNRFAHSIIRIYYPLSEKIFLVANTY